MLYILKIDDYLEILTDEEVKDFVAMNFGESISEEQNLRKVTKSVYFFLTTLDEVESKSSNICIRHYDVKIFNHFDPELKLINTKIETKDKLKTLLNELKRLKVQTILVLDYRKRNDSQIFHSCTKLTASDSCIDEAYKSMHQSIMTKIKKYACKDWIVLDAII